MLGGAGACWPVRALNLIPENATNIPTLLFSGKYDNEYIEYTGQVLKRCHAFGFRVFIDPHQDLFSRFSGGCGAPIWAVHACGLNPRNFGKTLAAILHSDWPIDAAKDNGQGEQDFPQMLCVTLMSLRMS